jgi:hypothetical protein
MPVSLTPGDLTPAIQDVNSSNLAGSLIPTAIGNKNCNVYPGDLNNPLRRKDFLGKQAPLPPEDQPAENWLISTRQAQE